MELINVRLVTPERHRPGPRPAGEIVKARAWSSRACSPTSSAKMRLEDHLAKTLPGSFNASHKRLLALTLGTPSTCSPDAHHEPSPHTTDDKTASSL